MQSNDKINFLNNVLINKKFNKETVNNLNYLSNIYFIDKEYYSNSILNKKKNNKILFNNLNQIIYNFDNLKLLKNINCHYVQIKKHRKNQLIIIKIS